MGTQRLAVLSSALPALTVAIQPAKAGGFTDETTSYTLEAQRCFRSTRGPLRPALQEGDHIARMGQRS
jgi:hypothetical protein